MIRYVKGNLLDSDCTYICHQVNCKGVMNSGIAKQIRKKWPSVICRRNRRNLVSENLNESYMQNVRRFYISLWLMLMKRCKKRIIIRGR